MTTREAQSTIAYKGIVENLLMLRDEARDGSNGEIKAMSRILANVMSLQLIDRFSLMSPNLATPRSIEPVLARTSERASEKARTFSTDNHHKVLALG